MKEIQISPKQSGGTVGQVTQALLDSFNVEQERKDNKANLDNFGGVEVLMKELQTSAANGLSKERVLELREAFGMNEFPESPMKGFFTLFYEAFQDQTLMILIAAALVSLVIGMIEHPEDGYIEGSAILIAVFLVAGVTAGNDYTKELQFRSLESSSQSDERTSVIRCGIIERINPKELVVGDIFLLQAGDSIPADAVVCDHNSLKTSESALTGESDDIKKSKDGDPFLLSSCLITEGEECRAVVIGIGIHSQWGKIKANLVSEVVNTPLQDKLEIMAGQIGTVGLTSAFGTFVAMIISIWARHNGEDILNGFIEAFILAVTIVVVAIPEGLPLAVTIALAYSTKKMYKDQCFIRILAACETMGNATNICSDKTGTLTENRMTVVEGYFSDKMYTQEEFEKMSVNEAAKEVITENVSLNRVAYLVFKDSNGNQLSKPNVIGSKTEGALMVMCRNWGSDYQQVKDTKFDDLKDKLFSFNSGKKRSTCIIHRPDGSVRLLCKGAPEWVLRDCTHYLDQKGTAQPLTQAKRDEIDSHILSMANNALRTLCLTHVDFPNEGAMPADWKESPPDSANLIVDCIVGIIDPLRADVKEAVRIAQGAGVTVRMVTGDNLHTANAIARQCGILTEHGMSVEGPVFRNMTPKDVDGILGNLQVMARSSPEDKFLLVTRLNGYAIPEGEEEWTAKHQDKIGVTWAKDRDLIMPGYKEEWLANRPDGGEVVGVTGDGTNDAPALKAADVGLSMGIAGTKVAQSASDIVILDDNFGSIVKAIMWGRSVYDGVRKFLQFQLTVNVVALLIVFIGACAGFAPPLNAVMMLWINLVMDTLGALALATEPPKLELLKRKPYKRSAPLISWIMIRNILVQSAYQLALLLWLLFSGAETFGIRHGETCANWAVKNSNEFKHYKYDGSDVYLSCSDFKIDCGAGDNEDCYFDHKWADLPGFASDCLECTKMNWVHGTLIFNTFVFCQFFNEYNAKSINSNWDIFSSIPGNYIFLCVDIVTLSLQFMLVEVGGEFIKTSPLTFELWIWSILMGFGSIPIGILMRFIPVEEDPNTFSVSYTAPQKNV